MAAVIQVDNAFSVAAPVEAVFDALGDIDVVVACLPGARVVGPVDSRNVLAQARVMFGRNAISYRGSLHVTGDDRSAARISFRVRGREIRGDGVVEAIVDVILRDAGGRATVATVQADASITGRAAGLSASVVEAAARTLLTRFGEALGTRIAAGRAPSRRDEQPVLARMVDKVNDIEQTAEPPAASSQDTPEEERPVAGQVRLMTEEPVPAESVSGAPVQRLMQELDRRPWLAPAAFMGLLFLVMLFRRRRH